MIWDVDTGVELEEYFSLCDGPTITGIDLFVGILCAFKKKFSDKKLKLIADSYFGVTSLSHGVQTNVAILTQALIRNMWVASMG